MHFKPMNSCCAAYLLHGLDYISPYNSWWVENGDAMLKKYEKVKYGMTMRAPTQPRQKVGFDRDNVKQWFADHPDLDFDNVLDPLEDYFWMDNCAKESDTQFYLASVVPKWENAHQRWTETKLKPDKVHAEALTQEMKDQVAYWYGNGYMLYAITNENQQGACETALKGVGFKCIASVKSRNGTTLNTWFVNSKELDDKDMVKYLGAKRAKAGWRNGQMVLAEKELKVYYKEQDERQRLRQAAWEEANPDGVDYDDDDYEDGDDFDDEY